MEYREPAVEAHKEEYENWEDDFDLDDFDGTLGQGGANDESSDDGFEALDPSDQDPRRLDNDFSRKSGSSSVFKYPKSWNQRYKMDLHDDLSSHGDHSDLKDDEDTFEFDIFDDGINEPRSNRSSSRSQSNFMGSSGTPMGGEVFSDSGESRSPAASSSIKEGPKHRRGGSDSGSISDRLRRGPRSGSNNECLLQFLHEVDGPSAHKSSVCRHSLQQFQVIMAECAGF